MVMDVHRRLQWFGQQGRKPIALWDRVTALVTGDQSGHAALRRCTELPCPVPCSPGDLPAAHDRHCRLGHELQLVHHHAARPGAVPPEMHCIRPGSVPYLLLRMDYNRFSIKNELQVVHRHAACIGTCAHSPCWPTLPYPTLPWCVLVQSCRGPPELCLRTQNTTSWSRCPCSVQSCAAEAGRGCLQLS